MKKTLSALLCASMIFGLSACGNSKSLNYVNYEVENYNLSLPSSYSDYGLLSSLAETNCIALFKDKNEELPELWIYEDELGDGSLKDFIIAQDKVWGFDELEIYLKNNEYLGRATFDEDWYGRSLINEAYFRVEDGNKVLWFDFAYDDSEDIEAMHSYVVAIAENLGF